MIVICDHAKTYGCNPTCVHSSPHEQHKSRCKCGSCGNAACNELGFCVDTNRQVKCIPFEAEAVRL